MLIQKYIFVQSVVRETIIRFIIAGYVAEPWYPAKGYKVTFVFVPRLELRKILHAKATGWKLPRLKMQS